MHLPDLHVSVTKKPHRKRSKFNHSEDHCLTKCFAIHSNILGNPSSSSSSSSPGLSCPSSKGFFSSFSSFSLSSSSFSSFSLSSSSFSSFSLSSPSSSSSLLSLSLSFSELSSESVSFTPSSSSASLPWTFLSYVCFVFNSSFRVPMCKKNVTPLWSLIITNLQICGSKKPTRSLKIRESLVTTHSLHSPSWANTLPKKGMMKNEENEKSKRLFMSKKKLPKSSFKKKEKNFFKSIGRCCFGNFF